MPRRFDLAVEVMEEQMETSKAGELGGLPATGGGVCSK